MGLQGPPYAVLSPLVTDPLAPPGDPESSLFLTCHFVFVGRRKQNEALERLILICEKTRQHRMPLARDRVRVSVGVGL